MDIFSCTGYKLDWAGLRLAFQAKRLAEAVNAEEENMFVPMFICISATWVVWQRLVNIHSCMEVGSVGGQEEPRNYLY